jgi:hypothetical protein
VPQGALWDRDVLRLLDKLNERPILSLKERNCKQGAAESLLTVNAPPQESRIPFHVMPGLAQLVPQNGHATANAAVPPWQSEKLRFPSAPYLTTNQQVRPFQEHQALWQAYCPFLRSKLDQPLEERRKMT